MMETSQLKAQTVTIINPMCQTCEKRYTCTNKTFMNCYVPDNKQMMANLAEAIGASIRFDSEKFTLDNLIKEDIYGETFNCFKK